MVRTTEVSPRTLVPGVSLAVDGGSLRKRASTVPTSDPAMDRFGASSDLVRKTKDTYCPPRQKMWIARMRFRP